MLTANAACAANNADHATHAAKVIEGEQQAAALLRRIRAGLAEPDELAAVVAHLHDEALSGFCRLLQKTLESRHG